MATKPTDRFTLATKTILLTLEGTSLQEPNGVGGLKDVTLGMVLTGAVNTDKVPEGVTLTLLDRLELMRQFQEGKKEPSLKIETVQQLKLLVAKRFENSPIVAGQALELLGDKPSDL